MIMKRVLFERVLPVLAAILLSLSFADAQEKGGKAVSTEYMTENELPDAAAYLPAPSKPGEPLFAGDIAYYEWSKALRATDRGRLAREDADDALKKMVQRFEPAVGILISQEKTPNLYRLLSKANRTASNATRKAKNHYNRVRPFVQFSEPSGIPESEESYAGSASYPSGHSTRGWTMALILSELLPDRSQEILRIGYEFGTSRVIVGYHYESDVQAARIAASAAIAVMHSDKVFLKDMKKAKKELLRAGLR